MDALQFYKLPIIQCVLISPEKDSSRQLNSKALLKSLEDRTTIKFRDSDVSLPEASNGSYSIRCIIDLNDGEECVPCLVSFETTILLEVPYVSSSGEKWFGARLACSTKVTITDERIDSAESVRFSRCAYWSYSFFEHRLQSQHGASVEQQDQLYNAAPTDAVAAFSGVARSAFSSREVVRVGSVLLSGPSGSGGRTLVQAIARQCDAHVLSVSTASFYAGVTTGATAEWAQKQVREAVLCAASLRRCVLLWSDLHLLAPSAPARSSEAQLTEAEESISEALGLALSELEGLQASTGAPSSRHSAGVQLLVVGYTHDEQQVHAKVRDGFRDKVHIPLPSARDRRRLMRTVWNESETHTQEQAQAQEQRIHDNYPALKLDALADSSTGLSVLPLLHQCRKAVAMVLRSASTQTGVEREAGASDPFARVAGLEAVKQVLQETVLWPRRHSQLYRAFSEGGEERGGGGEASSTVGLCAGILLFGPPGTGKTLLPRTLTEELGCSLVNLRISDVVRGEIGTSEKRVAQLFLEAKRCAPSVLFIDEFQALFTSRSGDTGDSGDSSLTATLSGCFDDINVWNRNAGAESLVTVIASTNEPWAVDPGFLRPGRLDKCVFVGPLDAKGRLEFLASRLPSQQPDEAHSQMLSAVATATQGFTGADLTLLLARVQDACAARQEAALRSPSQADFDGALRATLASTCADDILDFEDWIAQYPYLQ